MGRTVLIIQRFYYSFREGFFDYLSDISFDFKLINATSSRGKVKVHSDTRNKRFIIRVFYFVLGNSYVIFPLLFFRMIFINPKIIVTEGGQNTINNIQVFLYSKIFKCKYIIWDLGKGYAEFNRSAWRDLYMRLYVSILHNAYYIYGYNTQSKSYFQSLGIPEDKIVVLNNTIDTRKISRIKSSFISEIPEELREPSGNGLTFLIFVGALVKSKNIEDLAVLMTLLGPTYFLIIVGDGSPAYKEELEILFKKTNHLFVGYKRNEQLLPYYRISSFSVLPGLGGLSINQAMAFGVPVVCKSADGAEKDLVINNKTGYIYNDLNDLYNYILSKEKNDWEHMGKNAEHLIYSHHSVESMMNKFISYL